jgi:hypothetical protein
MTMINKLKKMSGKIKNKYEVNKHYNKFTKKLFQSCRDKLRGSTTMIIAEECFFPNNRMMIVYQDGNVYKRSTTKLVSNEIVITINDIDIIF